MIYTPKSVQRPEGFMGDKKKENEAFEEYKKAVLRVLVQFKSPRILRLVNDENQKLKVSSKSQTWDHVMLFESELIPAIPHKSEFRLEQYHEWLGKIIREVQSWEVDTGRHG